MSHEYKEKYQILDRHCDTDKMGQSDHEGNGKNPFKTGFY